MSSNNMIKNVIDKYIENAILNRIPIYGTIEITSLCNFNCIHCYIPSKRKLIDSVKFKNIIDQCYEMGCRFITITGGEPLSHPKFVEMYKYAWKKGLSVTVFSNGFLINTEILELFKKYPPKCIEITVYAATDETYKKITGVDNCIAVLSKNLQDIKDNRINLKLKTFLLNENVVEFKKIKEFCAIYSENFRYDYDVMPKTNKNTSVTMFNISAEAEKQFKTNDSIDESCLGEKNDYAFSCSAGKASFLVDSNLDMRICNFAGFTNKSLIDNNFYDVWNSFDSFLKIKIDKNSECFNCKSRKFCEICPVKCYMLSDCDSNNININPIEKYCKRANSRLENVERK